MQAWDPRGDASTYVFSTYDWTGICHGIALCTPLLLVLLIAAMFYHKFQRPILRPLLWGVGAAAIYLPSLYIGYHLSDILFNGFELHFLFDGRKIWLAQIMTFIFPFFITVGAGAYYCRHFATENYPAWFPVVIAFIPFQFIFFGFFPYLLGSS